MEDFQAFQDTLQAALVETTRSSTALCAEDLAFHRSLNPGIGRVLDHESARLLSLAERLLRFAASGSEAVGPRLANQDAVDTGWGGIVDVVDSLLERADTSLDEFTGIIKRLAPSNEQSLPHMPQRRRTVKDFKLQDLPKPQSLFEHVPKNDATCPWKPLLTSKPHAVVPLERSFSIYTDGHGVQHYQNPYQPEIERYQYPPSVYAEAEPIMYHPFETTTATFVDTLDAVHEMLAELKTAKEIAIDLEHHDRRSYIGIVSLMQISTRNKDWIVDTLKPWRRQLQCLNEVFTDPSVVKVLHGAHMDTIWLQRDLGLYIVGLFDTHHAAKALGYSGGSLAFLLQKFVNFTAQKQYQVADWRIRPLPGELFDYARSDTHFLLYIFDNMRNELVRNSNFVDAENDLLLRVLEKSKEVALQTYESPVYNAKDGFGPMGWQAAVCKYPNALDRQQFSVFKAMHQWRDTVAREDDESTHYIMANRAMFSVARAMPLDKDALLKAAQPLSSTVHLRAEELIGIITRAKEAGVDGPEMWEVLRRKPTNPPVAAPVSTTAAPSSSAVGTLINKPVATCDVSLLRANWSSFWGNAFLDPQQRQQHQRHFASATDSMRLALPLPPLTAEIFVDPADARDAGNSLTSTANPASRAEHAFVKAADRLTHPDSATDGVFVISQMSGKKRKLAEMQTSATAHAGPATISQAEEVAMQCDDCDGADRKQPIEEDIVALPPDWKRMKSAAKLEKSKRQKLKKAESKENGEEGKKKKKKKKIKKMLNNDSPAHGGNEREQPFDYASAPSVLATSASSSLPGRNSKNDSKEFNPYARAADAPKGLGRVQRDRAGKSATFGE